MTSAITFGRYESGQRERWRLSTAVVISAVIHAMLLSISLGGQTFGLPALKLPWQERRLGANDLQVLLLPSPVTAPAPKALPPAPSSASTVNANPVLAPVERPAVASPAASMTSPPPAIGNSQVAAVLSPPPAPVPAPTPAPFAPVGKPVEITPPVAPATPPANGPANSTIRNVPIQEREAQVPDNASDGAQTRMENEARERALEVAKLEQEKLAAERLRQAELMAEAQRAAARQEQQRLEFARQEQERAEAARQEGIRQEQLRQAQLEAVRQEQLRQDAVRAEQAARDEAARKEAERQALIRQEELRREQARQEEKARQEAARLAQERAEVARLEAARKEAIRQEEARQAQQLEAARQDAIKQEAARQEAAKQEAARQEQAKKELALREKAKQEEEREERLRAIGRQLAEEAAQRDAASKNPSRSLLPSASNLRRGWLFGRADPNAHLVQYAEAMGKKFELNMAFDMVREVVKQRHVSPMVTVAIRADGSVEKVTFVVSSGVPAIDDAIRRVVTTHAPYGAFPPNLARQFDVIEIRRTWIFDTAIRLQ